MKLKKIPFKFKKGDEVYIADPGSNHPIANEAARSMKATNYKEGWSDEFKNYRKGYKAIVLGRTRLNTVINVYLIAIDNVQHVVGESGLESGLKGILLYEE